MAKHVKILEGHSVKEWESKYAKKIAKGKLKVYTKEEDLPDYAKYWKINNKYYQVTTIYEWYAKSLRKSVGLTVALTCTAAVATVCLVGFIIQLQYSWEMDNYGCSVSFYAGDGTFADGSKSKVVTQVAKGTLLKNVKGYKGTIANPTAIDSDYTFGDWVVDDGKETTIYTDETPITENISLKAIFDFKPSDPKNFDDDTWETVFSVIEKGKDYFIDTYCKDYPDYDPDHSKTEEREKALYEFMDSPTNWKTLSVGNVDDYGVRLIGLDQDKQFDDDPNKVNRALATFEFNECIMQLPYSYEQGGSPYYTQSGSGDHETAVAPTAEFENCALKTYTEDIVQTQLPSYIQRKMKTVKKRTLQIHNGFKWAYDGSLQSYQFNRGCLDGTYEFPTGTPLTENKLEMVETHETLFSLSLDEIGATKIPFKSDDVVTDGVELMKETTQANKTLIESVLGAGQTGEGFYDENTNDFTGEYLFYSDEWGDSQQHSYEKKRMKKYFIGDATKSVEAQYRLRSIYIPNEYDVDTADTPSGNKDFRCFETWNISEVGDFGPYKNSPNLPDNTVHHFFRGDMSWASIFVAPAFCL